MSQNPEKRHTPEDAQNEASSTASGPGQDGASYDSSLKPLLWIVIPVVLIMIYGVFM